jgi:signal transduction histidine kinase
LLNSSTSWQLVPSSSTLFPVPHIGNFVNKNSNSRNRKPESADPPRPAREQDTVVMARSELLPDVNLPQSPTAGMMQAVFDALSEGAALVDMQGRLVKFNAAAEAIFGMGPTAGPSENWSREYGLFLPDGRTPFPYEQLPLIRALRGEHVDYVDMFVRNPNLPDGKCVRVCASPIFDEHGVQTGAMAITRDETQRKKIEAALESERRFLRHLITTQDRDRRLTGYDLHDGVVQLMTGALMRLEALASKRADQLAGDEDLAVSMQLVREAMDEARRLIGGLRPPGLEGNGLIGAIEYLIEEHSRRSAMHVKFVHAVQFQRLSALQESTLFRIVQEALNNAAKHSGAAECRVELRQDGPWIHVEVRDAGRGFDLAQARLRQYGLRGIEERARLLGGSAEFISYPGQGTAIRVTLPLINAPPDDIAATEL